MKKLLGAVAMTLLLALPASAQATHAWNGYHWARSSNPFSVYLNDHTISTYTPWVVEASRDWSVSSVLDAPLGTGSRQTDIYDARYGITGWVGRATIWFDVTTGHIFAGQVQLNDTYLLDDPNYATDSWRDFVTCQEVGHTFGLAHQDENFSNENLGSCMDYTAAPDGGGKYGPSNRQPNQHDYDELALIYTHLDGGGGGDRCKNPGSNGRWCRAGGNSVTFILPTLEAARD